MNARGDTTILPCEDSRLVEMAGEHYPTKSPIQVKRIDETGTKTKSAASRLSILKLWAVILITIAFCAVLLVAANISHSLTLRVEAYHSLYNLLSLLGCLLTMKLCSEGDGLKNTFGWARVELLSTLCTLLFLGSLCFGVAVDSIQTTAHAGHQDSMHHPMPIIALAGIGLFVNTIVFFLIGGYTHHQGCLLERKNSIVWIKQPTLHTSSQGRRSTDRCQEVGTNVKTYQGIRGTLRDISGLIMVMICATIVLWDEGQTLALYVDPAFAVLSAAFLLFLSYPYGKECCHILLQTIPGHIDVQSFSGRLLRKFPEIVNVHHLHIWSLTPGKVVATAHVVFNTPGVYKRLSKELLEFFTEEEISKVTLQPEFVSLMDSLPASKDTSCQCLLQCGSAECDNSNLCQGCTDVTSINRNNRCPPEQCVGKDSTATLNACIQPRIEKCTKFTSVTDINFKHALRNNDCKGNSFNCITHNDDVKLRTPLNGVDKNQEKSCFHSLQDLRIHKPNSSSGRFGEYLAAFEELRMKDTRNSLEQI